jgi:hypothetical protein
MSLMVIVFMPFADGVPISDTLSDLIGSFLTAERRMGVTTVVARL